MPLSVALTGLESSAYKWPHTSRGLSRYGPRADFPYSIALAFFYTLSSIRPIQLWPLDHVLSSGWDEFYRVSAARVPCDTITSTCRFLVAQLVVFEATATASPYPVR